MPDVGLRCSRSSQRARALHDRSDHRHHPHARGRPHWRDGELIHLRFTRPALVLFCLATRSSLLSAFEQAGHFAINVLAKDQQALSNRFARPSSNTWTDVKYRIGSHGCALVAGALGAFECAQHGLYQCGDHLILVGEVLPFRGDAGRRATRVLSGQLWHIYPRPVGRDGAP